MVGLSSLPVWPPIALTFRSGRHRIGLPRSFSPPVKEQEQAQRDSKAMGGWLTRAGHPAP